MKSFAELKNEELRLIVLQLLSQSADYRASAQLLHQALPSFSHAVGMERLGIELAWLQVKGLARVDSVGGVDMAVLTQLGADVAEGREVVSGVKRPRPGD